jgi:hypothetical protein
MGLLALALVRLICPLHVPSLITKVPRITKQPPPCHPSPRKTTQRTPPRTPFTDARRGAAKYTSPPRPRQSDSGPRLRPAASVHRLLWILWTSGLTTTLHLVPPPGTCGPPFRRGRCQRTRRPCRHPVGAHRGLPFRSPPPPAPPNISSSPHRRISGPSGSDVFAGRPRSSLRLHF